MIGVYGDLRNSLKAKQAREAHTDRLAQKRAALAERLAKMAGAK